MTDRTVHHRRLAAERNAATILDATEQLLAQNASLSMAAVAAAAGVSRQTLYAHFRTLRELVEAVVVRAIDATLADLELTDPEEGPADQALQRVLTTAWGRLAMLESIAAAATEHLPSDYTHRTHEKLTAHLNGLVERGRREGVFRDDVSADWLITAFYALVHGADEHARRTGEDRDAMLAVLAESIQRVLAP